MERNGNAGDAHPITVPKLNAPIVAKNYKCVFCKILKKVDNDYTYKSVMTVVEFHIVSVESQSINSYIQMNIAFSLIKWSAQIRVCFETIKQTR